MFGGRQYRPLLHVRDVATAVIPHLESNVSGIFNLGTENATIIDLAERIAKDVATIEVVDTPFQDTRNYRVSFKKAEDQLGFKGQYTIDDAIDQMSTLVDAGRVKDLSMAQFSNLEALRPYLRPEAIPLGEEIRTAHSLSRHTTRSEPANVSG